MQISESAKIIFIKKKFMDYAVFEKNMENVRKQGDFKVLISEKKKE